MPSSHVEVIVHIACALGSPMTRHTFSRRSIKELTIDLGTIIEHEDLVLVYLMAHEQSFTAMLTYSGAWTDISESVNEATR